MQLDLAIRKTHHYVGSHSDLDEWERLEGAFRELYHSPQVFIDDDDASSPMLQILLVAALTSESDLRVERALRDTYSSLGCSCLYDCCGCVSSTVESVSKFSYGSMSYWQVLLRSWRNY